MKEEIHGNRLMTEHLQEEDPEGGDRLEEINPEVLPVRHQGEICHYVVPTGTLPLPTSLWLPPEINHHHHHHHHQEELFSLTIDSQPLELPNQWKRKKLSLLFLHQLKIDSIITNNRQILILDYPPREHH